MNWLPGGLHDKIITPLDNSLADDIGEGQTAVSNCGTIRVLYFGHGKRGETAGPGCFAVFGLSKRGSRRVEGVIAVRENRMRRMLRQNECEGLQSPTKQSAKTTANPREEDRTKRRSGSWLREESDGG